MATRKCIQSLAAVAAVLFCLAIPCQAKNVYMIGNSFSHNSGLYSISALARQDANQLTVGAHINSGSPLHNIWGRPNDGREISPEFGKYRNALAKYKWDVVTLQPFYKRPYEGFPQSSMQTDIDSILRFIELTRKNPANRATKFYIYTSWPFLWTGKPFREAWDQITVDDLSTPTSHSRDYFEHLVKRLRSQTDAEIFIIPVAEVMYELDKKMQTGKVPGIDGIGDIMGDKLHLDAGLGHYVAGATVYATLFRKDPAGLVKPKGHYDGKNADLFAPQLCEIVHKTIWDVVCAHAYTGVATKSERQKTPSTLAR